MVLTQSTQAGSEKEEVAVCQQQRLSKALEVRGRGIGPEISAGNWNKEKNVKRKKCLLSQRARITDAFMAGFISQCSVTKTESLKQSTYKEERFVLVYSFKVSVPVLWVLLFWVNGQAVYHPAGRVEKVTAFTAARKQTKKD